MDDVESQVAGVSGAPAATRRADHGDPRYEALRRSGIIGLITVDDGRIVDANDTFLDLLGYTRADLEAGRLDWRRITPPDWHPVGEEKLAALREHGRAGPFEKEYLTRDGERVPVRVGAALLPGEGGRWVCLVEDQREFRRALDELSATTTELDVLLRAAPVAFALVDRELRYVRVNEALARMNELPIEAHVGRRVVDVVPHLADTVVPIIRRVLDGGGPVDGVEIGGLAPSGTRREVVASYYPVGDDDRPHGVGMALVDVTERNRLEAELRGRLADRVERQRFALDVLQSSLFSDVLPEVAGVELAARYLPATEELLVGGDWFDAVPLEDGRVLLVVGDVAGHGIAGVETMGRLRNATRAYALDLDAPAAILERLNRFLLATESHQIVTQVIAVVEPSTGRYRFARAGHPWPLVVGRRDAGEVEGPVGPPLGAATGTRYAEQEGALSPGGLLALYSDGLVEHRTEPIDVGVARLDAALRQGRHLAGDDLCSFVVDRCVAEDDRRDDVCLLVARRVGG